MNDPKSRYTLSGPCSNCPFRSDVKFEGLRPERVREIGQVLIEGGDFHCHKTVDYDDEDGSGRVGPRARACGGAMATLANEGKSTQMQRITERLGMTVAEADPSAPVYGSIAEWVHAMNDDGETEERVYCEVVGDYCDNPPGFSLMGGVTRNLEPATCDTWCPSCDRAMCRSCQSDGDLCVSCDADYEEDE